MIQAVGSSTGQSSGYKWGPFDVDLFAPHHNKLLKHYFSFLPDPQIKGIDALAHPCKVKSKTICLPAANHSPRNTSTSLQPSGGAPPIGNPKPSIGLAAWNVSGIKPKIEVFQRKLSRSFALHGDMALRNPIHLPGRSGFGGAVKGVPIPFQQLLSLESNDLLPPQQSGFRSAFSTTSLLLKTTTNWMKSIDSGCYVGALFLDLQKAFDTVNHTILLNKLSDVGVQTSSLRWFENYLEDRTRSQLVRFEDKISTLGQGITCGVPQGLILHARPLLFSVYDLYEISQIKPVFVRWISLQMTPQCMLPPGHWMCQESCYSVW